MQPLSVYLHIPFCRHRCAYCDFNTYAGLMDLIPNYVEALKNEIRSLAHSAAETLPVHTVFFGGGTPSLLSAAAIGEILQTLADHYDLAADAEISLEANPGTLSAAALADLRAVGLNRLSLGMQSAHPDELAFLERQHRFEDLIAAVKWARQAGFDNLSLDLIFGLPEQRLEIWAASLIRALDLAPEHLSLYALTIEPGTPLNHWAARGLIPVPNPDLAAEMYQLATEKLAAAGYAQYEISNWAKMKVAGRIKDDSHLPSARRPLPLALENPQYACRHNLQYWRNQSYLGFGAGAHGFVNGLRLSNVLTPQAYIEHLSRSTEPLPFPRTLATISAESIDRQIEMNETMMMGLRLTREGVSATRFQARFDCALRDIYGKQIDKFLGWDLLEWMGDHLRLTERGYLLGNQVFSEFI